MKLPHLSDAVKGILLIIAGCIILFDTIGFASHLLHSVVLFGAIVMIILGAYMANIHKAIYRLLSKKNDEPKKPEF